MHKQLAAENRTADVKRYSTNPYGKATFLTLNEQKRLLAQVNRETKQEKRNYPVKQEATEVPVNFPQLIVPYYVYKCVQ